MIVILIVWFWFIDFSITSEPSSNFIPAFPLYDFAFSVSGISFYGDQRIEYSRMKWNL